MNPICDTRLGTAPEPNADPDRTPPACPVCLSDLHRLPFPQLETFGRCGGCGLILDLSRRVRESMIRHYVEADPHQRVAESKSELYRAVLRQLDARVTGRPRRLFDVGCGHGHFLRLAATAGWQVLGADIVPQAVRAARERVPEALIFEGELHQAGLESGGIQAVTLWDALDQFENPAAALAECRRILAPGGTIALRVRNGASQLWIHRCGSRLEALGRLSGLKPPGALHRYCFSPRAIERIMEREGFTDVAVRHSPLTRGDPYRHLPVPGLAGGGKRVIDLLARWADRTSRGRCLIGPSLLAWGRKP